MIDRTAKLKAQFRSSLSMARDDNTIHERIVLSMKDEHHTTSFHDRLNIWTICLVRLFTAITVSSVSHTNHFHIQLKATHHREEKACDDFKSFKTGL